MKQWAVSITLMDSKQRRGVYLALTPAEALLKLTAKRNINSGEIKIVHISEVGE